MERLGQKWTQVQAELGRSADACRDKYRELATTLRPRLLQEQQGQRVCMYVQGWGVMGLLLVEEEEVCGVALTGCVV